MCNLTPLFDQSLFHDCRTRTVGTTPQALAAPNQYFVPGDIFAYTYNQGARLVGTTSATKLSIAAVTWSGAATAFIRSVTLYVDGVAQDHSYYQGAQFDAIPYRWEVTLDGNPHTIEIEEAAPVVGVYANAPITWTARYAPKYRVLIVGDSISTGQGASVANLSWPMLLRHSLTSGPAGYGVAVQARSGALLGNAPYTQLASLCDGTTRNVVVVSLMINDHILSSTTGQFQSATDTVCAGILANTPAGTRIVLVTAPQCPNTYGGATLAQLRAIFTAKAAANPGVIYCVDNTSLFAGGTPWAGYLGGDGIHPIDAGHLALKDAVRPVVITAATAP